jgi:hypothetical protein
MCVQLFEALRQRIDGLQCRKVKTWCCYFALGRRKRFAYVTHRVRTGRLEVWALGEIQDTSVFPNLDIRPRMPTEGTWGTNYPTKFSVRDQSQVRDAVEFLFSVSYPLS